MIPVAAWRAALIGLITLAAGCTVAGAPAPGTTASVPSLADTKRQVAEYVDSGRYAADIADTVTQARSYLAARLARGGKLAIVLDIDETSLSNLPALRANDYGFIVPGPCADLPRGPCGFLAWVMLVRAEPIKPVLELTRVARGQGVAVFFLTGRPERLRAATEANLKAAGYEWTAVLLKPDALNTPSAVDFKAAERKKLVDQGYVIVVNMGDQMSDLDGGLGGPRGADAHGRRAHAGAGGRRRGLVEAAIAGRRAWLAPLLALLAVGVLAAMVVTGRLRENQQLVKASGQGVMAEAPAEVDRIELAARAGHWLFVRNSRGWQASANGAPVPAPLAQHLDDSLKFMHVAPPVRVMAPAEWAPTELREFDLDPPRYTATLYHGGRRVLSAWFGGLNPQEVLQYMKLDGRDEVYLMSRFVGQEWEQALREAASR